MAEGKGTRLIPNLSDTLGKLPPQALDLEEAVLGALMLERDALAKVIDILKPEHFYTEVHKIIYNAILALHSNSKSIDMRTVIHNLRATGHIEIIGGASYIAELTSKVSSASSIREHAIIIVEMGLRRQLIVMGSKMQTQAYEESVDVLETIERIVSEITFFQKHNIPENSNARLDAMLDEGTLTEKPPEDIPIIYLNDAPVGTLGNYSLVVGKKKSRKTLLIVMIVCDCLRRNKNNASRILLFDTEQGKSDVWLIRQKIYDISGLWIKIVYLRGRSPKDRRDMIARQVERQEKPPLIVVIDGIRDLMQNINDPVESTDLIVWLEKITNTYNLHIVNILHLNKTDNNARGHIGSELLNKAEVTVEVELDEKNNCTMVKCESSRRKGFETFAFTHDQNGLPVEVGAPVGGNVIPKDEKTRRLQAIFEDGNLKYGELWEQIKIHFEVGVGKAKSMVAELLRQGYIIKSGKNGSPDTVYKLLTTTPEPKTAITVVGKATNGQHVEQIELNVFSSDDLPF